MVTEEEIRDLIASQTAFSKAQRTIISGAFEIGERMVRQVLVPRRDVFSLNADLDADDAIRLLIESGHSRAPVTETDLDDTLGMVNVRSLLGANGPIRELVETILEVPETITVVDALRQMQLRRRQMALVVDEYGGIAGIVTVEDLVEELVGEIYDETDPDALSVFHDPDGSVIVPGSFPVHDLADYEVDLPEGDYATVAGLLLDRLGYLPTEPGASVEVAGRVVEALEVEGRVISLVRIHPASSED